jgi:membrane protease YdiL (CAAX protease family)
MDKLGPASDSPRRLIVAAIGWYILSWMPLIAAVVASVIYQAFAGRYALSEDMLYVRTVLIQVGNASIMLAAALLKGRALGHGDVGAGLGDAPISNQSVIALIAVLPGAYIVLQNVAHPDLMNELFIVPNSPWRRFYAIFISVILTPLAEELFFRGWLWTGLRKHWGALPTAVVTSALFLAVHWSSGFATIVVILPPTVACAAARHLGRSVRASIPVHMIYNLTDLISPLVLTHFRLV